MKEISLLDIVAALLQRWWAIVITAIIFGLCGFIYCELFATPTYIANGSAVISTGTSIMGSDDETTSMKTSDFSITLALSNSFVDILSSRGLYEKVADKYDFGFTAAQLKSMTTVSGRENSLIADVSVRSSSVEMSVKITNAILEESQGYMNTKMPSVVISPLDTAKSASLYSPRTAVTTLLAAVVGALVSAIIVFLFSYYDNTIKGEEDIARTFGMAVLGSIPDFTNANQAYEYKLKNT